MKTLIAYFSWSGNTKTLAEGVAAAKGYDLVCIERKVPYSSDYHTCAYVEAKEEYETKARPAIKPLGADPTAYDEILLFFPVWWYTVPAPVATFVEGLQGYEGKVRLFGNSYTNDPQYMVNALGDLKGLAPDVTLERGLFNQPLSKHLAIIR